jgi:hypothetical protein
VRTRNLTNTLGLPPEEWYDYSITVFSSKGAGFTQKATQMAHSLFIPAKKLLLCLNTKTKTKKLLYFARNEVSNFKDPTTGTVFLDKMFHNCFDSPSRFIGLK